MGDKPGTERRGLAGLARGEPTGPGGRASLFERALIVDRSRVARHLLRCYLRPHCKATVAAESLETAEAELDRGGADLVVLDATLDGALGWIVERCDDPGRPSLLLLSSRPSLDEETRATLIGAIGYLAKPVSFPQISRVLRVAGEALESSGDRICARPLAQASLIDPSTGHGEIACEVLNLGCDGALLASAAELPAGTQLTVRLEPALEPLILEAEVIRVDAPAWSGLPGLAVAFRHRDEQSRRQIRRLMAARLHDGVAVRQRELAPARRR